MTKRCGQKENLVQGDYHEGLWLLFQVSYFKQGGNMTYLILKRITLYALKIDFEREGENQEDQLGRITGVMEW
jgi:hypothetical protein